MESVWIWLIVAVLVVAAVVFFLRRGKSEVQSDQRRQVTPEAGRIPAEGAPGVAAEERDAARPTEAAVGGSSVARHAMVDDESSALDAEAAAASEPRRLRRAEPDDRPGRGGLAPETGARTEPEARATGGASVASVTNVPEPEARTTGGASVARVAGVPEVEIEGEEPPPGDHAGQHDVDAADVSGGVQGSRQAAAADHDQTLSRPQGAHGVPGSGEVRQTAGGEAEQHAVVDVSGYGVEDEEAALADAAQRHGFGLEGDVATAPASVRAAGPGPDVSAVPNVDAPAGPSADAPAGDRHGVRAREHQGEVVEPGTEVAPEETVRPDDLSEDVTQRSYTVTEPEDDHVPVQAHRADQESTGEFEGTGTTRSVDAGGRHEVDSSRAEDDLAGGYAPAGEAPGQEGPADVENVTLEPVPTAVAATDDLEEDVEPVPVGWNGPFGPGSADANEDGSGPEGWTVKGAKATKVYLTPDISVYDQAKANVWFIDEDRARDAGFRRWDAPAN